MKKVLALVIALISIFSATAAFAADITVKVNDEAVEFDREPYVEDGKVMIPYRFVAEKLVAMIAWDSDTKTVFTAYEDAVSTMQIGNAKIFGNDATLEVETAPSITIDRTFVTEEVLEFALGVEVLFDEATSTVTVTK